MAVSDTGPPDTGSEWIDLLVTDSLERPLAGAHYMLHAAGPAWPEHILGEGQLDAGGRVSLPWRDGGMTLVVGHRALVLSRGPSQGLHHTRNRLTCLGFDTGPPGSDVDPQAIEQALQALAECATNRDGDPLAILERWVQAEIGVGEVAVPIPPPAKRRRFRRPKRRGGDRGIAAGTHLRHDDLTHLCRTVTLALTPGARGTPAAANRIVVYDWFTGYGCPPRASPYA
jgi:hypothetical protein